MSVNLLPDLTAAPCDAWATVDQFVCNDTTRCGGSPCPSDYVSPWSEQDWLDMATSILFNLTGRRFSVCTRTVTPTPVCGCAEPPLDCPGVCTGCGRYPTIDLGGNVTAVTAVVSEGATVGDSLYRIDDHRWLVRLADGDGVNPGWPTNYRVDETTSAFTVTYRTGVEPPAGGAQACVALACALRQMGDGLGNQGALKGQTVTSINTRGMSAQTDGLLKGLRAGKSGIGLVDAFLAVWLVRSEDEQGRSIAAGGVVWSPDLEDVTPRRTTWMA